MSAEYIIPGTKVSRSISVAASVLNTIHQKNSVIKAVSKVQEHKEVIAEAMEICEFNAGQQIYCQGDTGSRLYIIKEGSVTMSKTTDPAKAPAVLTVNAGQVFGERALIKDEIRYASNRL